MKIAYVNDALITCGGCIVPFEHCRGLRKLGHDAFICANGTNEELQNRYPDVPVYKLSHLNSLDKEDILVANWWMQCEQLEKYNGRKIQFVQGNDLKADYGDDLKKKCLETRQNPNWEIMAVSRYAGEWTERVFTIIPNGISDIFYRTEQDWFNVYMMETKKLYNDLSLDEAYRIAESRKNKWKERDIDALIEGNDEKLKNIDYSINKAKKDGHKNIVWFGRTTHPVEGVECISNPSLEEIARLYRRSKHFYKHSLSEGFCLPLAEAMVSGCICHTGEMGNTFEPDQDFKWETKIELLDKFFQIV
jgi:hypothetical protein